MKKLKNIKNAIKYNHFGVCPECWGDELLCRNVNRVHFFCCDDCKVAWGVGSNLFSNWQYEDQSIWDDNLKLLEEHYRLCEEYYPPKIIMWIHNHWPNKRNLKSWLKQRILGISDMSF